MISALSLSSVVVLSDPRPAAADLDQIFGVVKEAAGTLTHGGKVLVGGATAAGVGALEMGIATAGMATAVFGASAWGTYEVCENWTPGFCQSVGNVLSLRVLWDPSYGLEQASTTTPTISPTTYTGGGCWNFVHNPMDSSTSTNCTIDGAGGWSPNPAPDWVASTAQDNTYMWTLMHRTVGFGSTAGTITVKRTWSRTNGTPVPANFGYRIHLSCDFGGASAWNWAAEAAALGTTSGTVEHTWQASECVSLGGAQDITARRGTNDEFALHRYVFKGAGTYTTAAPSHKWRATTDCSDGLSVTLYSSVFTEDGGDPPDMPVPACTNATPTRYRVWEGDANGANGPLVLDWVAPSTETMVEYSDCLPGGSAAPCEVQLLKVSPNGLLQCSRGDVDCTSFDPETSTDLQYQCRWGTYVVPLTNCAVLLESNVVPETTNETNTGTDVDVVTGEVTSSSSTTSKGCMGGGWGWNPVDWVVTPVKCALLWAFAPKQDHLGDIQDAYNGSLLDSLAEPVDAVGGTVTGFRDGINAGTGDCVGPTASVPLFGSEPFTFQPLNSCSGPAQTAAATVKVGLSFVFLVLGGIAVLRIVLGAFGFRIFTRSEAEA